MTSPIPEPTSLDPRQLGLGMAADEEPSAPSADPAVEVAPPPVATYREPPVCGEWSYDDVELEDTSFAARRIDGVEAPTSKATPIQPITVTPPTRPMAGRPAAPSTGSQWSAGVAAPVSPVPGATPIVAALDGPMIPRSAIRPTLDALRMAFEQTPGDTARALAFATALERSGDAAGALAALDTAFTADADPFVITCAKASALGAMLKYDDAAKMLKKAAKLKPDDPEILVQTGILASRRGRWKDAIEPLQKGLTGKPDHAAAHYYMGEALNHTDRLQDALEAYERAAELDPENWRAMKGCGIVLDRMGRSADAAPYYRRARDAQRA